MRMTIIWIAFFSLQSISCVPQKKYAQLLVKIENQEKMNNRRKAEKEALLSKQKELEEKCETMKNE